MIGLHSIPIEQPEEKSPYLKAALAVHGVVEYLTDFWYYPQTKRIYWMYGRAGESDSLEHWARMYDERFKSRDLDAHLSHITLVERNALDGG
jgi:hypothetical protein